MPGFEPYFEESFDEFSDEFGELDADEESAAENETNSDEICHWSDISLGNDELIRLPCFVHTLQLVVSDGFKENTSVKAAVTKVSIIAKFR